MHLLDANTLIEAKNRYYAMSICPAYWSWLLIQHQASKIGSILPIKEEIAKGNDDLATWVNDHHHLFIDVSDNETQAAFGQIAEAVASQSATMKPGAIEEFLGCADPWLIAKAMTSGACVVTHEIFNPDIKRKFLIPNICQLFNVSYMNTFELLANLEAQFVLPQS